MNCRLKFEFLLLITFFCIFAHQYPCRTVSQSCLTLQPTDYCTSGFSVFHCLLEFAQIRVHWVSDAIQPSHPLLSPSPLPSVFPSIRVFSNESVLRIRWSKYWSFSFSISPSSEYSGLISFRIDWFDLLAVQGTLKSLLQHHNSKASVLKHSVFFMVHLSHLYMNTGKTIDLTIWTFDYTAEWCPCFLICFLGSNHELLIAKFRLKLKKVGKTTRPFRYDLNQIPYAYTVEVRNRFKGLDLIDRVSD